MQLAAAYGTLLVMFQLLRDPHAGVAQRQGGSAGTPSAFDRWSRSGNASRVALTSLPTRGSIDTARRNQSRFSAAEPASFAPASSGKSLNSTSRAFAETFFATSVTFAVSVPLST